MNASITTSSIARRLAAVLFAVALPRFVAAESLPASVAACAAVSDVLQRLACYDREVARYTNRPTPAAGPGGTPQAASPTNIARPTSAAVAATAAAAAATEAEPRHVTAHIIGIAGRGDDMVVRLDNGQVWEQVQKAEATLGLRTGDRVTIDRGIGNATYWLAGPSQAVMQVKRNQ